MHQIGALLLLALGSLAIAFLPLSLLHVIYRKKRRRLREEELLNQKSRIQKQQQQKNQQQQTHQNIVALPSSSRSSLTPAAAELGISGLENEKSKHKKYQNKNHSASQRRTFIANWFGLEGQSLRLSGSGYKNTSNRTLSSSSSDSGTSGSNGSLYQHLSEVALASTLAIPSIILELIRSLDGGLLLAALFLILLPQLRTSFDTFMTVHVNGGRMTGSRPFQTLPLTTANETNILSPEANFTSSASPSANILLNGQAAAIRAAAEAEVQAAHSAHLIAAKAVSPVPLVELILCLAFFALHFIEEFAQLCLRYRKYFWACNSSLVYSSSTATCEFSSLDYRISRTKRFLIDCSRKTSSTTTTSSARTSPQTISGSSNPASTSRSAALSQQLRMQFSVVTEKDDEDRASPSTENQQNEQKQTEVKKIAEEDEEEIDPVCENHGLQDSLQLYGHVGQPVNHQNNQADYEPNSLLTRYVFCLIF